MEIRKIFLDFATTIFGKVNDDELTVKEQEKLEELDKITETLKQENNTELLRLIDKKGEKRRARASKKMAEKQEIEKNTERKDEEREN